MQISELKKFLPLFGLGAWHWLPYLCRIGRPLITEVFSGNNNSAGGPGATAVQQAASDRDAIKAVNAKPNLIATPAIVARTPVSQCHAVTLAAVLVKAHTEAQALRDRKPAIYSCRHWTSATRPMPERGSRWQAYRAGCKLAP